MGEDLLMLVAMEGHDGRPYLAETNAMTPTSTLEQKTTDPALCIFVGVNGKS